MRTCFRRCILFGVALAVIFVFFAGCSSYLKRKQMEKVAKDWCTVIRASQIVPVYPLTEDLQVGDAFLVQTTVDKQHDEYKKRGFLPMDNHVARISTNSFDAFYDHSFYDSGTNNGTANTGSADLTLPKDWLESNWENAPSASFPTYSFSVKSGGGLNMAIPVQGVPIGLSLLGSDAGEGTITISKARTYGIDTKSLVEAVQKWEEGAYPFLLNYASGEKKTNYIRVISRIYLAKEVNISIRAAESKGASIAAGAPKPVELMTIEAPENATEAKVKAATVKGYTEGLAAINKHIQKALEVAQDTAGAILPGGTVKVVGASSRSVSLKETFNRPIVVGYLAFDMRIGKYGILGPPIPTHAVLEKKTVPPEVATDTVKMIGVARLSQAYKILLELQKQKDHASEVMVNTLNSIAKQLPDTYEVPIFSVDRESKKLKKEKLENDKLKSDPPKFQDVIKYYDSLIKSKKTLQQTNELAIKDQWLTPTEDSIKKVQYILRKHDAILRKLNEYTYIF